MRKEQGKGDTVRRTQAQIDGAIRADTQGRHDDLSTACGTSDPVNEGKCSGRTSGSRTNT